MRYEYQETFQDQLKFIHRKNAKSSLLCLLFDFRAGISDKETMLVYIAAKLFKMDYKYKYQFMVGGRHIEEMKPLWCNLTVPIT